MTVVCPECGSVNKKGNKFCFECGMKLPTAREDSSRPPAVPKSSNEAKRIHLKKRWIKGELTAEEYRGHLLRLRLKERFGSDVLDQDGNVIKENENKEQ